MLHELNAVRLQARLQKALELPNDFVLVMNFEGTDIVEKADASPLTKVNLSGASSILSCAIR